MLDFLVKATFKKPDDAPKKKSRKRKAEEEADDQVKDQGMSLQDPLPGDNHMQLDEPTRMMDDDLFSPIEQLRAGHDDAGVLLPSPQLSAGSGKMSDGRFSGAHMERLSLGMNKSLASPVTSLLAGGSMSGRNSIGGAFSNSVEHVHSGLS